MSQAARDRVVERIYVKGIFELTSPCLIGSGESENTDIDLIRDSEGRPYIPGTSLAGVLRNYFSGMRGEDERLKLMFGRKKGEQEDTTQSRLYVLDARMLPFALGGDKPEETLVRIVSVRDGVRLNPDTKTAMTGKKYDYEVLEPRTQFLLRMELVIRECDPKPAFRNILYLLLKALQEGNIRIGAKRRRGFGRGRLHSLHILQLDFEDEQKRKESVEQWLQFDWDTFQGNTQLDILNCQLDDLPPASRKRCRIRVPLRLEHSVMIRDYRHADVDYAQLDSMGQPVIPGTSWAGALRGRMRGILIDLLQSMDMEPETARNCTEQIINSLFGNVDEEKKVATASRIWFGESIVNSGKVLKQTRIKIDRFTGGVVHGALFDGLPVYHGDTCLEIELEADSEEQMKGDVGLLILALKDLMKGYLAVGGETNVGKGIFSGNEIRIQIDEGSEEGISEVQEQDCLRALLRMLRQYAPVRSS